jgi:hypothetical protein
LFGEEKLLPESRISNNKWYFEKLKPFLLFAFVSWQLYLLDENGQTLAECEDSRMLGYYSPYDGCRLHMVDCKYKLELAQKNKYLHVFKLTRFRASASISGSQLRVCEWMA